MRCSEGANARHVVLERMEHLGLLFTLAKITTTSSKQQERAYLSISIPGCYHHRYAGIGSCNGRLAVRLCLEIRNMLDGSTTSTSIFVHMSVIL